MKKILTPIVFLLIAFPSIAQETATDALKLAKICYQKELGQRLQFFPRNQSNTDKAEKKETLNTDEVYNKLILAYQELFTPQEISGLLAFYNSALGIKMIAKQTELQSKAMTIISHWEMKQNGIDIVTYIPPVIENEAQYLERQQKEHREYVAPKETPFPKIANLEDLKKILLKEPNLMGDSRLLEEIVGKEEFKKLFTPQISIDQEIKDPNKKTN